MNHFDEFVNTLKVQSWMSDEFRQLLISKFNIAMSDAYERGKQGAFLTHVCRVPGEKVKRRRGLNGLTPRDRKSLRALLGLGQYVNAIKLVRDLVDVTLKEAKEYVDGIQSRIPTGINTVTGKNRYPRGR